MKKDNVGMVITLGLLVLALFAFLPGCQREQAPPAASTPPAAVPAPGPAPTAQPAVPPAAGTPQPGTTINPLQVVGQVQMGMSPDQVQKIMGAPSQTKQKGTKLEWEYLTPQGKVEIEFLNNQVSAIEKH
jgi:outer membrane protein assembly factor BamE (lipoprotein component of BamABCDE complex)